MVSAFFCSGQRVLNVLNWSIQSILQDKLTEHFFDRLYSKFAFNVLANAKVFLSFQLLPMRHFRHFKQQSIQMWSLSSYISKMSIKIHSFVVIYFRCFFSPSCFIRETRSHFSSCETSLTMWIWIDLRLIVTLMLLLLFWRYSSLFCSMKRNETKLKHIESFTSRHFSSEFRFVASVRHTSESVSSAFVFFPLVSLSSFSVSSSLSHFITRCIAHCFGVGALCFQTMTSRVCCGYLWQFFCDLLHFVCHFFLCVCLDRLCLCQRKREKKLWNLLST